MHRRQFLKSSLKAALGVSAATVPSIFAPVLPSIYSNRFSRPAHAQEAGSAFYLPVMIHMGQSETPMGELVQLLKPGDMVVHESASTTHATVH